MKLNELRDTSYEIAKSKGWHDDDMKRSFADLMALVISELAEALEEHRKGCPPTRVYFEKPAVAFAPFGGRVGSRENALDLAADGKKPEGLIIELVDTLVRIGDCAGKYGWTLEDEEQGVLFVEDLVRKEDGVVRDSFGDWFCAVTWLLSGAVNCHDEHREEDAAACLNDAVAVICSMAHWLGITGEELERAIEIKHAYNRTRSRRHGGKRL